MEVGANFKNLSRNSSLVFFFFFQSERILSFIPPDGNFRLMSYHIGAQNVVGIPIYIRHNISFKDIGGGRLDITVGPRQTLGRTVSILIVYIWLKILNLKALKSILNLIFYSRWKM